MIPVQSYVHRILSRSQFYRADPSQGVGLHEEVAGKRLGEIFDRTTGEDGVGIYERALGLRAGDEVRAIEYCEIARIGSPSKDFDQRGLVLELRSGEEIELPLRQPECRMTAYYFLGRVVGSLDGPGRAGV